MQDINITSRDLFGNVVFSWKTTSNSGIEILLQKIVTLALSNTTTTYFNSIYGLSLNGVGKFNFGSNGSNDFQMSVASDLINLINKLMADDVTNNTPYADRLKSITINNIVYDTVKKGVALTLNVSTNSSSKLLTLPVK